MAAVLQINQGCTSCYNYGWISRIKQWSVFAWAKHFSRYRVRAYPQKERHLFKMQVGCKESQFLCIHNDIVVVNCWSTLPSSLYGQRMNILAVHNQLIWTACTIFHLRYRIIHIYMCMSIMNMEASMVSSRGHYYNSL